MAKKETIEKMLAATKEATKGAVSDRNLMEQLYKIVEDDLIVQIEMIDMNDFLKNYQPKNDAGF